MSVWKKMNDLTKGTIDWTRDVGLSLAAGPKFFWDIATAPWNDREEFNGFLNTISQATIDANKNTFRPLGGILSAGYVTGRNILREPASAVTVFGNEGGSLSAGLFNAEKRKQNQELWKKTWENRNQISLGQAMAPSQPQNVILKGISSITDNEEFLPQYLKSDFDVFDPDQRDSAFKNSIYGRVTSGGGDVTAQFVLDPLAIAGKAVKIAKMADDSFTAIKGIDAAIAGETNKYSKLAEDFAPNDTVWAYNHPWVRLSNDPATVAHLLGTASTKEEALYTMSALMGNPGSVAKLDILKRPDIAAPLRIASGELSRRDLKIFLRDENKIARTAEEGMLDLGYLRTPEEIAIDTEFITQWAKHDKYISQLTGIASPGGAPFTAGLGRGIAQPITRFLATARSVPFHTLEVGTPGVTVYQPTPFHKAFYKFSWPLGKRPSGTMNLNEGASIIEITTTGDRMVRRGLLEYDQVGRAMNEFAAAATPEAKKTVTINFEKLGFIALGKKLKIDPKQIELILDAHMIKKEGLLAQARSVGYVFDDVNDVNIKTPFFESQTSNFYPMADFDYIEGVLRENGKTLRAAWATGKNRTIQTLEAVNDLWKAGVLLRLGYPVRNAVDSQLRILAAVGSVVVLRNLGPGIKNLFENNVDTATRTIDKIKNAKNGIKPLSYEETKSQLQTLGREIAAHEKEIDKLTKALNKNPKDPDTIAKLVAEQLKLDTKKVLYDANNASLTKIEKSKISSRKKTIGQGEITLPSIYDTADGFRYTLNDSFAGVPGELFQKLNSAEKAQARILDDYSNLYKTKVLTGSRGAVTPDMPNYYTEWATTINQTFGNSAVIRKLLDKNNKIEDVIDWLKDDSAGILLRQRLGMPASGAREYVYQASGFLDSHMPLGTGIREAFLDGKINESFLRNAITDPDELPTINGLILDETINRTNRKIIRRLINSAFKVIGAMPENAWARNPLFRELYRNSLAQRLSLAESLNQKRFTQEEVLDIQLSIEMGARKDALKGVKEILYSVENRSNLAEALRFISPFMSAQLNSLTTWLKIGAQNPQVFSRAAIVYNAPNSGGFVTDKEGNIVPPSQAYNPEDTMWFQVPKSVKKIPIVGEGLSTLNQVGITKRSLDVLFMGQPFQLGIGPYFSVPVSLILKKQPGLSSVVNWAFPYGPSASGVEFFPTVAKRAIQKAFGVNDTTYARYYGLIMQTEYRLAWDEGRPYPSEEEIKKKTDAFYNMSMWSSVILPFAPQFESPFRLHIEKYRIYQEKFGIEAPGKFLEDYPEFFEFALSFSESKTKVKPTMTAVENSRRYSSLISKIKDDNPALIGAIVNGSSTSKFNPIAYWWQQQTNISPGSKEKFRGSLSPIEAIKNNAAQEGWIKFRKVQDYIDTQLTARGLTSITQKGAEDLDVYKKITIAKLASTIDPVTKKPTAQISPWYEEYSDIDRAKVIKTVSGLRKIISDPTYMKDNKDNPTWKSVIVYLSVRDSLASELAVRESKNIDAKSNADIRVRYDMQVKKLKLDDIGFSDLYDRFLSQDIVYNKYVGREP